VRLAGDRLALALVVATAAVAAGCGESRTAPRRAPRPDGPCAAEARGAVARAAGAATARTRVTGVSPGVATCVYGVGSLRVDVLVDTNPQAAVRFDRAVVERDQVAVWSGHHGHAPRLLQGVGQGADWFPDDRLLLTTDGRKLVSVTLVRSSLSRAQALRLAEAVARSTLRGPR
jgi:hypothetical protein